jgi:hypothetical protein
VSPPIDRKRKFTPLQDLHSPCRYVIHDRTRRVLGSEHRYRVDLGKSSESTRSRVLTVAASEGATPRRITVRRHKTSNQGITTSRISTMPSLQRAIECSCSTSNPCTNNVWKSSPPTRTPGMYAKEVGLQAISRQVVARRVISGVGRQRAALRGRDQLLRHSAESLESTDLRRLHPSAEAWPRHVGRFHSQLGEVEAWMLSHSMNPGLILERYFRYRLAFQAPPLHFAWLQACGRIIRLGQPRNCAIACLFVVCTWNFGDVADDHEQCATLMDLLSAV